MTAKNLTLRNHPNAVVILLPFKDCLSRPSPMGKVSAQVLTEEDMQDCLPSWLVSLSNKSAAIPLPSFLRNATFPSGKVLVAENPQPTQPLLFYHNNRKSKIERSAIPHNSARVFSERFCVRKSQFSAGILCVFQGKLAHFWHKRSAENRSRVVKVLPREKEEPPCPTQSLP